MKKLLFFICLHSSLFSNSQEKTAQINWITFEQAMQAREQFIQENTQAIKERKIVPKKVFIDAYTSWCGWCKKMDATTFKDPSVVAYMNQHYYAVKLNAEMRDTIEYDGHKFFNQSPKGKKGSHTLAISLLDGKMSYPTYVIMDENMHRSHIIPGYMKAPEMFSLLNFFGSNNYLRYKQYVEKTNTQVQGSKK